MASKNFNVSSVPVVPFQSPFASKSLTFNSRSLIVVDTFLGTVPNSDEFPISQYFHNKDSYLLHSTYSA